MYSSILTIAGILSHLLYFRHGDHHLLGVTYLQLFVFAVASTTLYYQYIHDLPWSSALTTTSHIFFRYLAGLYSSLLVYRFFLHPLRRFPGPRAARLSGFWSFTPKHTNHTTLLALHRQYGPIVRAGPAELSLILPSAVPAIYGNQSACVKDSVYDLVLPSQPLQNCRDRAEHAARRRIWSPAFSDKRLRGYEQRIRVYRQQLVDQLHHLADTPVNICKWFNLYSFDVMGDLAFGRGFDSLATGHEHWAILLLVEGMKQVGLFFPPWAAQLLLAIPGASKGWWRLLDFCSERLDQRIREGERVDAETDTYFPDISESLLAPYKERAPTLQERRDLDGDVRLIVVAGSDTTAVTLSSIFYELVRHPGEMAKLRAELAPYATGADDGEFLGSQIAHLDHLNGVINEALRLYPPVPGLLARRTPKEGIVVDGVYIPGNMTVSCPQYVMGRSELCYERADEFIPERWYKSPELIKDERAFAPFTIGPYSCIGRPLALMNLRATVARLVITFDVEFAPGEDGRAFVEKAQDNFVLYPGALNLTFKKR
ncbi:cytochrome P450 [Aspergillus clavatus NRRL 1]|uniref:Tryprostatin B 6-hydroxylase n=1 Tax=Aspergillus clavatus (strain ATCC 1007 / CBS 513.65 / DSM 816 / NCTC 3887 / NRRL 1 / QM 1276 / 107) TaxID=344612 RepID=A1CHP9_ASPCL|nr:cytochrome P450 monooxygenase, putative [Aspergillus clavatus NRRL 1]EAW10404.1 cytochrome P450 monooxygenase, putative [Aspergillus clavatus NRRL 1]